ncbi:MAG TPA: gliding motility-associated C-terminal domain-containing protein, partial [Saprospiraceae bacterium]|nr:gliding motility-associated C-terminal domain-containing protein [Saprospiraceae bacterium]
THNRLLASSANASGGTAPYGYGWSTGSAQAALAGLPAGTYIVTLTDAHGCTLTRDAAVPAYGKIPVLSPFTDTITCATPVAQIGATADQSNLYYTWSGPAGPLPHLANIPVAVPGTYTVKAVNAQGCTQTALLTVAEDRKKPVANAGAASVTAPCSATSVWLDAGASSSGPGFLNRWRGVSGGLLILDTAALKIAVQQAGWYTHTVQNLANGCTAADSVRVDWEAPIEAVFVLDSISCFGENDGRIQLKQVSGGKAPYFYSIDNQNFTTKNTFKNLSPGTYLLIVRDTFGCHWETMGVLSEPPALSVQLSASDTVIERGQFLYLEAVPSPPGVALSSVVWQPAGFDFTPGKLRQHVRPLENTEFSIQIFDLHGCPASDRIAVRVDNFQIYVPNVIYPGRPQNGAFTIFAGDGVTDIRLMRIYDRWGSLVFEKQHFAPNDLGLGWNGTDRGTPVNPGVFAWYAEVELRDGQRRLLKGDVTVLR